MSATPRPWEVKGQRNLIWEFGQVGIDLPAGKVGFHSDAELIVRAVNAFEPLVEALQAWLADIEAYWNTGTGLLSTHELASKSQAALRLAGALE